MSNVFKKVTSSFGRAVSAVGIVFKTGEVIKEASQVGEAIKELKDEVVSLINKYQSSLTDVPFDIRQLLMRLDRVLEEGGDLAHAVGLESLEKSLRDRIKPEMYAMVGRDTSRDVT